MLGGIASAGADEADDENLEQPKVMLVDAYRMLEMMEIFWLQLDEDSQDFICMLSYMKNKVSKICVNKMIQKDICL